MPYHLVCIHPFHGYERGQQVTDQAEIEKLREDRDHHFVKVEAPAEVEKPQKPQASLPAPDLLGDPSE